MISLPETNCHKKRSVNAKHIETTEIEKDNLTLRTHSDAELKSTKKEINN